MDFFYQFLLIYCPRFYSINHFLLNVRLLVPESKNKSFAVLLRLKVNGVKIYLPSAKKVLLGVAVTSCFIRFIEWQI